MSCLGLIIIIFKPVFVDNNISLKWLSFKIRYVHMKFCFLKFILYLHECAIISCQGVKVDLVERDNFGQNLFLHY